jgi:hypothetical protein
MQQFFKTPPGLARAGIVASKFLEEFFVAMDDAHSPLNVCFGGITPAALAGALKSGR